MHPAGSHRAVPAPRLGGLMAVALTALLAGACSADLGKGDATGALFASTPDDGSKESKTASASELQRAIEYWGKEYKDHPTDLKSALAYARNLKAAGNKNAALGVFQQASIIHGDDRDLASEYGRLALDMGQVQLAQQLLGLADDPMKPDWRVVSARGTVQAKLGNYAEAIPFYERALALAPNQTSVLNNLAMAHAANGDPAKAEEILRGLVAKDTDPKIAKNLALVLSLQGKGDAAPSAAPAPVAAAAPIAVPAAGPVGGTSPDAGAGVAPVATSSTTPARATKVANSTARSSGMRATKEPNAVTAPGGGWSTSVARAE